ncbi:RidA family protein [Natronorubrum sp. JWXQ-INN-674]|uniref:RidA family protein n=1 Tax=Natronorubrum halalkaliphilum TaxID=2691917 RepID=A0A6B0VJW5_9EURY|nr:RidA family protein [Natronorubrum halalkaliphilum]MXV60879.1 RidA family protein [Natronorubrum halalkaliphilum]
MERSINTEPEQTDRLSSTSKRQCEGTNGTGAFGMRTGDSDLVFFEGILPQEGDRILNDHSIEVQATACFDRLEAVLSTRELDLADVMKVEVQLTDLANRNVVDTVYQARFSEGYPPRTTTGVCSLPGSAAVQFDVIAAAE